MLLYLPETIQSFSSQSRKTVSSLIQSVKSDKAQISALIENLRSFDPTANYTPSLALKYSLMEIEGVIEFFRDSSLRVGQFFNAASSIGNILNSIVYIYESEIRKIEKDIDHLENFVDNYQFIVGEDDLFNFNYLENFDNDLKANKSNIILSDRDGVNFSNNGNYYIDSVLSKMSISNGINFLNQINNIGTIGYATNYSNYTTTDSEFISTLNETLQDNWTVTVKSPVILTSKLSEYSKYLPYDYSFISGAQAAVDLEFNIPVEMDTIRIKPNLSNGLQLLQVVLKKTDSTMSATTFSNQGEYIEFPVLNSPLSLNKQVDIVFNKSKISSIKFIFNQSKYTRNENIPIKQELISKSISKLVSEKRIERRRKTSRLQDIVYHYFRKNNDIVEIRKNRKNYTEYYSYRYPNLNQKNIDSVIDNINSLNINKELGKISDEIESGNKNPLLNIVESIVSHVIGSRNNLFNTSVYRTIATSEQDGRLYNLNSDGFIPSKNENSNFENYFQTQDSMASGISLNDALLYLANKENSNYYEYSFSISNISFGLSSTTQQNKACFISDKIETNGSVTAIKAIVNKTKERRDLTISNYDLREPGSYELSVCYSDVIQSENDWMPIVASANGVIDSEVLFFNGIKNAKLRFYPQQATLRVYKNGILENPNNWTYSSAGNKIIYSSPIDFSSIYVAEYTIDSYNYNQGIIEIDKLKDNSFAVRSFVSGGNPGQVFSGTGAANKVTLSYIPFIENRFSTAYYSETYGTVNASENVGYSPVSVIFENGETAINLTNYLSNSFVKASFYDTAKYLFFQNGKELIFNRAINQTFTVNYSYIPSNLRFRIITRNNIPGQINGISIDNVIIKCKVNNLDPFSQKLLRLQ